MYFPTHTGTFAVSLVQFVRRVFTHFFSLWDRGLRCDLLRSAPNPCGANPQVERTQASPPAGESKGCPAVAWYETGIVSFWKRNCTESYFLPL